MVPKKKFKIEYDDENRFNSSLACLNKYCPVAYSELIDHFIPEMRKGRFISPFKDNVYIQHLITDPLFEFVHGKICVVYRVNDNIITLAGLEPEKVFGCKKIEEYNGLPVTSPKDRLLVECYKLKIKKSGDKE